MHQARCPGAFAHCFAIALLVGAFPRVRGGSGAEVITASGSGGQWLFVVPSLDLVVAVVAANGDGLDLLYDDILPAITR